MKNLFRKLHILALLIMAMFFVPLAACGDKTERVSEQPYTPTNEIDQDATGGPCGDGTTLKPGEHCR